MSIPGLGPTAAGAVLSLATASGLVAMADVGTALPPAVQIVQAVRAGCPQVAQDPDKLVLATAISLAESNGRDEAEGDTTITDGTWGPSIGKFQIRSMWAQRGTGTARDAERLHDPVFNAKAMCEISGGGENWRPWSVYLHGTYRDRLTEAREAVGDPRAGVPLHQAALVTGDVSVLGAGGQGLEPAFAQRLAGLVTAAPGPITIISGKRDPETQLALFQASDGTGKWVASAQRNPDGSVTCGSNHCKGIAADLRFDGTQQWAHDNAARFGLKFPMDYEPWHIELEATSKVASSQMPNAAKDKGPLTAGKVADAIVARINEGGTGTCRIMRDPETPTLSRVCDELGDLGGWLMGE